MEPIQSANSIRNLRSSLNHFMPLLPASRWWPNPARLTSPMPPSLFPPLPFPADSLVQTLIITFQFAAGNSCFPLCSCITLSSLLCIISRMIFLKWESNYVTSLDDVFNFLHPQLYIYTYVHNTQIYAHICACICANIHIYTCIHTHTYKHIYMHIYSLYIYPTHYFNPSLISNFLGKSSIPFLSQFSNCIFLHYHVSLLYNVKHHCNFTFVYDFLCIPVFPLKYEPHKSKNCLLWWLYYILFPASITVTGV